MKRGSTDVERPKSRQDSDAEATPGDRGGDRGGDRSVRQRLRAAWMYHVEGMTQNEIAEAMQIGRVTVVRLLADALARREVKITIEGALTDVVALERQLEQTFGLSEAVVAPVAGPQSNRTHVVSAALGFYLSDLMKPGMRLGVGWGRTLIESLQFMPSRPLTDFTVVSLLGGISEARQVNPSEYAWQLARSFGGECYLLSAPALVDSPETRDTLIKHCGLDRIFAMAKTLDAALFSVGGMSPEATIFQSHYMSDTDRRSLLDSGAVGDLLYRFHGRDGAPIKHPINDRVMSIPIETIRDVPIRILASGGADKTAAIIGAMTLVRPTVFITDALTAADVLAAAKPKAR